MTPPAADPTVAAAAQNLITGLQQAGTSNLGPTLLVAGVLVVTVAVVYFVIKHFRAIAHV